MMLRAMSQVPKATQILVECQVTNALLGTMAAFKAAATVQRYCLDMLAKIASYHPSVTCKVGGSLALCVKYLALAYKSTPVCVKHSLGIIVLMQLGFEVYYSSSNSTSFSCLFLISFVNGWIRVPPKTGSV